MAKNLNKTYGHKGDRTTDCVRSIFDALKAMHPLVDVQSKRKAIHLSIDPNGNQYPLGSFANLEAMVELGVARWVDWPEPGGVVIAQTWGPVNHCFSHLEPERVRPGPGWILHATTKRDWYCPHDLAARLDEATTWKMVQLIHPHDVN